MSRGPSAVAGNCNGGGWCLGAVVDSHLVCQGKDTIRALGAGDGAGMRIPNIQFLSQVINYFETAAFGGRAMCVKKMCFLHACTRAVLWLLWLPARAASILALLAASALRCAAQQGPARAHLMGVGMHACMRAGGCAPGG